MNKKLKKLLRNPKSFFRDMYLKHAGKMVSLVPVPAPAPTPTPTPRKANEKYSVVCVVRDGNHRLDELFDSLMAQRLSFQANIHVVLVDATMGDASVFEPIRRWAVQYPDNVKCLSSIEPGLAQARNAGLAAVSTPWVTFVDPGDFLEKNYFLVADAFLRKHRTQGVGLLSTNMIYYQDSAKRFLDTHPLKYRFAAGDALVSRTSPGRHIHYSVNGSFFRTAFITSQGLCFDERAGTHLSGPHFVANYLLQFPGRHTGFLQRAKYFRRKEMAQTEMPDVDWQDPTLYREALQFGCLDVLERHAAASKKVPAHVQRTVLYHVIWYFRRLVNSSELIEFLEDQEKAELLSVFDRIFSHIDQATIESFELGGASFMYRLGWLNTFKQVAAPAQQLHIVNFDHVKSQALVNYYDCTIGVEEFNVGTRDIIPDFAKTVRHSFLERTFILERYLWVPLRRGLDKEAFTARLNGIKALLVLDKAAKPKGLKQLDVRRHFLAQRPKHKVSAAYAGAWLLMDRDNQADDNAEHLYRFLKNNHPGLNIHFVLRRDSHDWERLEQEGFRLLAFGTTEHETALRSCAKIISSHAAQFAMDYFGDRSLWTKQNVFLQHGVIHNDLSQLFAPAFKQFDIFLSTATDEYRSEVEDYGRYKFTKKEGRLTGMPRHDALLRSEIPSERMILIMPTWRSYLLGKVVKGTERELLEDFMSSDYAQAWSSLLKSERLLDMAREHGYRIVFFPHANIQPYLAQFQLPPEVEVLGHDEVGIQQLFRQAALMITDYSSVAFEMAFLQKPVIYYQFDEDSFFKRGLYRKGYFEYRRDGFGPVITEEAPLLDFTGHLLAQSARPDALYQDRMDRFFPFRDGRNCERVYEAIAELDQPMPAGFVDLDILFDYAQAASRARQWMLAERRWHQLLKVGDQALSREQQLQARLSLTQARRHRCKFASARDSLGDLADDGVVKDQWPEFSSWARREWLELVVALQDWKPGVAWWTDTRDDDPALLRLVLQCAAEAARPELVAAILGRLGEDEVGDVQATSLALLAQGDWHGLVALLDNEAPALASQPALSLLRARALRATGELARAGAVLGAYATTQGQDAAWHAAQARQADAQQHWKQVLQHLKKAYPESVKGMPLADGVAQVRALRRLGMRPAAEQDLALLFQLHAPSVDMLYERASLATAAGRWVEAEAAWTPLRSLFDEAPYHLAVAMRFQGKLDGAVNMLLSHAATTRRPPLAELLLRAELAHLTDRHETAAQSWQQLLLYYPQEAPAFAWERLQQARLLGSLARVSVAAGMREAGMERLGAPGQGAANQPPKLLDHQQAVEQAYTVIESIRTHDGDRNAVARSGGMRDRVE